MSSDLSDLSSKFTSRLLIWAVKAEYPFVISISAQCRLNLNTRDKHKKTLLYLAVQTGNLRLLSVLLRHGADPNICDRFGETPLHFAAKWGDTQITDMLLANNADPNFASENSVVRTPFWTAVDYHQEKIVSRMLRGGNVNVNYVNRYGVSLISYVVTQQNPKIIAMIQNYIREQAFKTLYIARVYDKGCVVYEEYLCDDLFKLLLCCILL